MPQITYAEQILEVNEQNIAIKRRLENGAENVKSPYPVLITVTSSAKRCRFYNAKRLMAYKNMDVKIWSAADVECEDERLGLSGSPTKVKKVDNVILSHKDTLNIENNDKSINELIQKLIQSHIIG